MIRSELVLRIAQMYPHLNVKDVEAVIDALLERIEAGLVQGNRVELRNFGVFSILRRAPAMKRNPRTGSAVEVGERVAIRFKPSRAMQGRLSLVEKGSTCETDRVLQAS